MKMSLRLCLRVRRVGLVNTAFLPGSIQQRKVNVELTASTIRFAGGSVLDAKTNGVWEPLPDGNPGKAPADFGAKATSLFFVAKAALRNILLDAKSGDLPVANGSFDSGGLV